MNGGGSVAVAVSGSGSERVSVTTDDAGGRLLQSFTHSLTHSLAHERTQPPTNQLTD